MFVTFVGLAVAVFGLRVHVGQIKIEHCVGSTQGQ
jgi:hypothetical protein